MGFLLAVLLCAGSASAASPEPPAGKVRTLRMRPAEGSLDPSLIPPAVLLGTEEGATLEERGIHLNSPEADRLRLDSIFDATPLDPKPWLGVWPVAYDLRSQNGQFKRFSLIDSANDFSIEVGRLGVVSPNPLLGPSTYVNARKGFFMEGKNLDASLKLQAGLVDLRARLFYDDAPALDTRANAALDGIVSIGSSLHFDDPSLANAFSADSLSRFRSSFDYPTNFESATLPVASALGQLGKSVNVWGPLDVGVVAGALVRVTGSFPNAALDETAGARLRVTDSLSLAAFAGVTETVGFVNRTLWMDSLNAGKLKKDFHPEFAPHFSGAVWGKVPGKFGPELHLDGGYQINPMTGVAFADAAALFPLGTTRLKISGRFEDESGDGIEFHRRRGGGEIGFSPTPGIEGYVSASHEDFTYGAASIDNNMLIVGLRAEDRTGPHPASGSFEAVFGGKDDLHISPAGALDVLNEVRDLSKVIEAVALIREGHLNQGWALLREVYNGLSPDMRKSVDDLFAEQNPDAPPLLFILAIDPTRIPADILADLLERLNSKIPPAFDNVTAKQIAAVAAFLDGPEVYERLIVRYARHMILEEMQKEPIPIWGQDVLLNPPLILALAHAYSLGLSPIPPMTARDARDGLDPFLLRELRGGLDGFVAGRVGDGEIPAACQGETSETQITECALSLLPPDQAKILKDLYGDRLGPLLKQAISWHSDVIRRELDRTLLEVIRAAEALNEMTVDKGIRIGELNTSWLISSFGRIGKPARTTFHKALAAAKAAVEEELKVQEEKLRRRLRSFGEDTLKRLKDEGLKVEVAAEDWAPLLAHYGDADLLAFIQTAAKRVGKGKKLIVGYNKVADFGIWSEAREDAYLVKLPPITGTAKPRTTLRWALESIDP